MIETKKGIAQGGGRTDEDIDNIVQCKTGIQKSMWLIREHSESMGSIKTVNDEWKIGMM